jgi:hypothetical protein
VLLARPIVRDPYSRPDSLRVSVGCRLVEPSGSAV